MAAKIPIRTVYTGSEATGLAEYQSGDYIAHTYGGTGLAALGSAGQVLKVNSGASALEYGNVEAILNIEGMTDGSGITILDADKFVISDGGTEKYVTASQISTYIGTELNVNIDAYPDGSGVTVAATDKLLLSDGGTEKYVNASQIDTYVSATTSTLTNKTLTTPTLTTPIANAGIQLKNGTTSAGFLEFFEDSDNGANKVTLIGPASTADVTVTLPASADTLVGKATTDTLTNKTLTAPTINGVVGGTTTSQTITALTTAGITASADIDIGTFEMRANTFESDVATGTAPLVVASTTKVANLNADLLDGMTTVDEDDMASNSATSLPTQQSVVAYVAAQITAEDLDVTSDSGTIDIDLNSETLTIAGGTGLASSASSTTVTLAIDSTVTTLTGTQTLTNKTITSPVITTPQINDTSADHQYVFAVSELAADRTVTLPLLAGADEFTFNAHTQTLTNKTINSNANTIHIDLDDLGTFTGTLAEFNSGLQGDSFVSLTGSETLTNKTLTTPILTTPVANAGLQLKNAAASAGFLEFFEDSDNGSNKVTLIGPASTADVTVTLPAAADTLVGKATTDTFTNKSIDLGTNTITGSLAEFNAALQSESFVSLTGSETLTNKTLTSPTINGGTFSGTFTGTMDITGSVLSGASPLVFEGATAYNYETTLAFVDPTVDRTITFPNLTGTVALQPFAIAMAVALG